MSRYQKSILIFFIFVVLFELFIITISDLNRPHWGDEWHFQDSIKKFGEELSLDVLIHYEEMSTPLPFIIYALWGRLFGFDLFHLRILSVIIAIIAYLVFHRLIFLLTNNGKVHFFAAAFLVVHPYMVGFSIFVFTDMLAILFLLLSFMALVKRRPWLWGISMALAILSRQYILFFTAAAILYYSLEYIYLKKTNTLKMLSSSLISIIPYCWLIILWDGFSPNNIVRNIYLKEGFYYHPKILSLYICLLFFYHIPLLVFYVKNFYRNYRDLLISLLASTFYILFPVSPSQSAIDNGTLTVGLFHRFLVYVFKTDYLVNLSFYISFFLAFPIIIYIIKDCHFRWRQRYIDLLFFIDLSILSFFVVMPFSYLGWEKYFLPIVPLVIVRILLINQGRSYSTEPMKY